MRTGISRLVLLTAILILSSTWLAPPVAAKKASSVILEVAPQTVVAGQSTRTSVTLTDAETGEGLKRRFHLYYSTDGGNSWNELGLGPLGWGELWTDENGRFSSSWSPPGHLPHDYLLKAHWEGDETYEGCTAIQTLTVDLPSVVPVVLEDVRSLVSDTTHYVFGWIRNTGTDKLKYVKVAVGYYNATGGTIGAAISEIPIGILKPGESSPFMFRREPAAEVARYEVVVSRFSVTEEEPYVDFEFSSHRSYREYGTYHVVGLVKNTGSMSAKSVEVLAVFYDASDRLLGYVTGSTLRSMLTPGERSPFDAWGGSAAGTPHHYTLIVEAQNTTAQPYPDLQVVSHKGRIEYSSYRVSGDVKNLGRSCVDGVKVIAAFYDAEGNIVSCGYDYGDPSSIIPEQTSKFEVYTYTDVGRIHHYELWPECNEKAWWHDVQAGGMAWKVFVTSNSSWVGSFKFNRQAKTIAFNVTGYSGIGWCRAVVPKLLLGGPFTVLVDGATVTHTQSENDTHTFLSFTYQHSEHKVELVGTTVIKEKTTISASVSKSTVAEGEEITVSGAIEPSPGAVPVVLTYTKPDGSTLDRTVTSSSEGLFTDTFEPTPPGSWNVIASWKGSETHEGAVSETAYFAVKILTTISCQLSARSLTIGESVTVSGSISPARAEVTVAVSYRSDGLWSSLTTVTTASDGSYSYSWTPTRVGTYQLKASWEGDATHSGATSEAAALTVTRISTAISCSVSPSEVVEGAPITASGSIRPPVPGRTVTLTYRKPDGTTFTRTATTASDGSYADTFNPRPKGSWTLTASWPGDEEHLGATSPAVSFAVTKVKTTISASVSKTTITEGDEITTSGAIEPTPGAVSVTLTYTKPDGTTLTRTVTTTSGGAYTDTWKPAPKGSWTVTTSWVGSETHEGATSSTASFTVKEKACIIATATYGSELSPEVQYLRGFRNQVVLSTFAGSQFMELFNAWYYSFSPGVAGFIADCPILRSVTKAVLYPLVGTLHLSAATYQLFSFNSEVGVVMAGLVASSLIGLVYFSPLLAALLLTFKHLRKTFEANSIKALSASWLISLALILVGEVSLSPTITTIATGAFVLATLSLSAAIGALSIARLAQSREGQAKRAL